ncbi:hypothetical protein EPN52_01225 [bacterium]|nr:MAG: hypothetical protein EPN52_01225 [bacterium]
MRWSPIFSFHLAPDLDDDSVTRAVEGAYRPFARLLLRRPLLRGGLVVEAGVSERLWRGGHEDVIIALRTLVERGQLEPVDTAAYGAPLPLLPEEEIRRQLARNASINRTYFGLAYRPTGIVARAYAASPLLARAAHAEGYRYLLCDTRALGAERPSGARLRAPVGLALLGCDRVLAEALSERTAPRVQALHAAFAQAGDYGACILPVRRLCADPARVRRLLAAVERFALLCRRPSELLTDAEGTGRPAEIREPDGGPWLLWHDPENAVHRMQWRFIAHALLLAARDPSGHPHARECLDRALCADFLAAASPAPLWDPARIERGAALLLESALAAMAGEEEQAEARYYALEIGERARSCAPGPAAAR